MIVGNFASVCPTVIIIVENFHVFGVYELDGGDMKPQCLLLLSSVGVAFCISWIPTVSVVSSAAAVAVSFYLRSIVITPIFMCASLAIFPDLVLALHLLLWLNGI